MGYHIDLVFQFLGSIPSIFQFLSLVPSVFIPIWIHQIQVKQLSNNK